MTLRLTAWIAALALAPYLRAWYERSIRIPEHIQALSLEAVFLGSFCPVGYQGSPPNFSLDNPYQQCLEDICGSDFVPTITEWDREMEYWEGSDLEVLKQTEPGKVLAEKIDSYYAPLPEELAVDDETLTAMAKKPMENIALSIQGPTGRRMLSNDLGIFQFLSRDGAASGYRISEEALAGKAPEALGRWRELKNDIENALNHPHRRFRFLSARTFFQKKYGDTPLRQALLRYTDELVPMLRRYEENVGNHPSLFTEIDNFKLLAQRGRLSSFEIERFLDATDDIEILDIFFVHRNRHAEEITRQARARLTDWLSGKSTQELERTVAAIVQDKRQERHERRDLDALRARHALDICMDVYHKNRSLAPDQRSIDNLHRLALSAQKSFGEGIQSFPGISNESKRRVEDQLRGIVFKLPLSKEEFHRVFMESLDHKVANKQRASRIRPPEPKALFTAILMEAMEESRPEGQERADEFDNEIADLCHGFNTCHNTGICDGSKRREHFTELVDGFGEIKEIQLGYELARDLPNHAVFQSVFHEIAHAFEKILLAHEGISQGTLEAFRTSQSCLGERQRAISGNTRL